MQQPPCNVEAAKRIVQIQTELAQPNHAAPSYRERLLSEQRTIWEAIFPGTSYEQIEEACH